MLNREPFGLAPVASNCPVPRRSQFQPLANLVVDRIEQMKA
jgi:hypothetical protein